MADASGQQLRWHQGLTKYHWWVLVIGVLSWMFDCMDQRIFILCRAPAIKELMHWTERKEKLRPEVESRVTREVQKEVADGKFAGDSQQEEVRRRVDKALEEAFKARADTFGNIITALMMFGWSVGGFLFGVFGDRLGRVKTLSLAIAVYSVFTGLSGLAVGVTDLCIYRFLMGGGIGGAFATAATLIAETMPAHSRATALGIFQALSAVGNITGSFIARFIISANTSFDFFGLLGDQAVSGWRALFMVGVLPAILVVIVMRSIKEPQAWQAARATAADNIGRQLGDIKSLFGVPRWRRNTLVGLSLAVVGVTGLWGVGFFSPELVDKAFEGRLPAERIGNLKAMGTLLQDVGAVFGMLAFTYVATRLGRKPAFGAAFVFCWLVVSGVFLFLSDTWHVYVLYPVMGFASLSVFGGYSIYFPELYPTRLRSSGTGFCYNVGRVVTGVVIFLKILISMVVPGEGSAQVFRTVAVVLAGVYLLGLLVLIWAPETKGEPLPTDDDDER